MSMKRKLGCVNRYSYIEDADGRGGTLESCAAHILANTHAQSVEEHIVNAACQAHHARHRSATKSLHVLIYSWLHELQALVKQGIPRTAIVKSFQQAVTLCIDDLAPVTLTLKDFLQSAECVINTSNQTLHNPHPQHHDGVLHVEGSTAKQDDLNFVRSIQTTDSSDIVIVQPEHVEEDDSKTYAANLKLSDTFIVSESKNNRKLVQQLEEGKISSPTSPCSSEAIILPEIELKMAVSQDSFQDAEEDDVSWFFDGGNIPQPVEIDAKLMELLSNALQNESQDNFKTKPKEGIFNATYQWESRNSAMELSPQYANESSVEVAIGNPNPAFDCDNLNLPKTSNPDIKCRVKANLKDSLPDSFTSVGSCATEENNAKFDEFDDCFEGQNTNESVDNCEHQSDVIHSNPTQDCKRNKKRLISVETKASVLSCKSTSEDSFLSTSDDEFDSCFDDVPFSKKDTTSASDTPKDRRKSNSSQDNRESKSDSSISSKVHSYDSSGDNVSQSEKSSNRNDHLTDSTQSLLQERLQAILTKKSSSTLKHSLAKSRHYRTVDVAVDELNNHSNTQTTDGLSSVKHCSKTGDEYLVQNNTQPVCASSHQICNGKPFKEPNDKDAQEAQVEKSEKLIMNALVTDSAQKNRLKTNKASNVSEMSDQFCTVQTSNSNENENISNMLTKVLQLKNTRNNGDSLKRSSENVSNYSASRAMLNSRHFKTITNTVGSLNQNQSAAEDFGDTDVQKREDGATDTVDEQNVVRQITKRPDRGLTSVKILRLVTALSHGCDDVVHALCDVIMTQYESSAKSDDTCLRLELGLVHTLAVQGVVSVSTVRGLVIPATQQQLQLLQLNTATPRRCLLFNGDLSATFRHKGFTQHQKTKIISRSLEHMENTWLERAIEVIIKLNVTAVLVQGTCEGALEERCRDHGVAVLTRVPYTCLQTVAQHGKCTTVTYVHLCNESHVSEGVQIEPLYADWMDQLHGNRSNNVKQFAVLHLRNIPCTTSILSHPVEAMARLREEEFMHALYRAHSTFASGRILQGGAKTEFFCAQMLRRTAEENAQSEGFGATVFEAVARGFLDYARTTLLNTHTPLCEVAGDSFSMDTKLSHTVHADDSDVAWRSAVVDDWSAKREAWSSACHTVCQLLQLDMEIVTGLQTVDVKSQKGLVLL